MAYPRLLLSFVGIKSVSVTTRYIAKFHATGQNEELKAICKLGYGLDFVISAIAFVIIGLTSYWFASSIYKKPEVSWLMVVYAASFPFLSLTGTSRAILAALRYFHWLSVFQILDRTITLVLMVGFLIAGFGVPGMIIANTIGHVIIGMTMMIGATYVLQRDGLSLWWKASSKRVAPLLRELGGFFGWHYIAVTLSGLIWQVPIILLGRLRGPEEAGFYRLATSIVTIGSYFETSMGRVTYPILSARSGTIGRDNIKNTLKRWTFRAGLPAGALLLLAVPFFPILIPMVFGDDYSPMLLGIQVMIAGSALTALFFWLNIFYYASGKVGVWTKAYGIYTVSAIVLGWFFIQLWGFLGMAVLAALGKAFFTLTLARKALKAYA
jgi:O-antigen/teichoic acid export membrane protein